MLSDLELVICLNACGLSMYKKLCQGKVLRSCTNFMGYTRLVRVTKKSQCIIAENQRFHRADSRIRLQWCQKITVHEYAKIAKY